MGRGWSSCGDGPDGLMDIEELQKRAGITEGEHFAKAVWNFERALKPLHQEGALDQSGQDMLFSIERLLSSIKRELKVP